MLTSLQNILDLAKQRPNKRLAVAFANDLNVLEALKIAFEQRLVIPILIGDKEQIIHISKQIGFNLSGFEVINTPNTEEASKIAVSYIKSGKADILMKGMLPTAVLLRAVVNKEHGLTDDSLLSHFAITQLPSYHKLIAMTDAAMNIKPGIEEKISIINNSVSVLNKLGYNNPKVAILSALEYVNPKIESSVHAEILTNMNINKQIGNCTIYGPLALDNAINKQAAIHKGIDNVVAGDADLLVTANIDSGNLLYKAMNFLAGGTSAAIITGAKMPIVLTSRSDSEQSKLMSIALAVAVSE
jgi:phosphate butyryltransferase